MADVKAVHITRLIAIPAVITLAVTILRVVGELKHWPTPWFSTAAGGGAALVGISWLPIIFGPYFALKLAAVERPASFGKAILFAFLGLVAFFVAGVLIQLSMKHPSVLTLGAFILTLIAGFVPLIGWRSLGRVLLAYALAARIPVLIVMYYAMRGNGGAGWGTHYDAVAPGFATLAFAEKYLYMAVMPQLTLWIGWTIIVGAIFGTIVAAIVHRGKQPAPAAV
ncbi:MAG: hypothetical protein WAO35_20700 [Terriglobia bacterium]